MTTSPSVQVEPFQPAVLVVLDLFASNPNAQIPRREIERQVTAACGDADAVIDTLDQLYTMGFVDFGTDPKTGNELRTTFVASTRGRNAMASTLRMYRDRGAKLGMDIKALRAQPLPAAIKATQQTDPDGELEPTPETAETPEAEPKRRRRSGGKHHLGSRGE